MKKRIKQGAAAALALVLTIRGAIYTARAATGIETDRDCSVSFQLDGSFEELQSLQIPVEFYQVAQVDETGVYEETAGFESLELGKIDHETTASEWEEKAAQAARIIEEEKLRPVQTTTVKEGAKALSPGMYLVEAQQVQSPEYTYSFTPYLLSLPNNYYSTSGDDTWVYEVTAGLKPQQEVRYGSVRINKTLDTYHADLGGASFIFSVEAVKDGETVYSDVVSLVFDGPGNRSVEVENIPAGAQVTVTEVYSGASYELTTAQTQTASVIAQGEPGAPAQVSFANTYNGENNGGSSIVNHFDYTAPEDAQPGEGSWSWSQQTDSTDVQG